MANLNEDNTYFSAWPHSSSSLAPDELFYEASRQNIIVILIFWSCYIFAYAICAYFVELPSNEEELIGDPPEYGQGGFRKNPSVISLSSCVTSLQGSLERGSPSENGTVFTSKSVDLDSSSTSLQRHLSLIRKRRSNISRIMLLARPERRIRSLPPALVGASSDSEIVLPASSAFQAVTVPDGAASVGSILLNKPTSSPFKTEQSSPQFIDKHISPDDGMESMASRLSSANTSSEFPHVPITFEIFSSFVPEYVVTVFSLSLIIQSVIILPYSILGLAIMIYSSGIPAKERWKWSWSSLDIFTKWWLWLWSLSLFMLLIAIPLTWMLIEGREFRNAPLARKLHILVTRLWVYLQRNNAIRPTYAFLVFLIVYFTSSLMGWTQVVTVEQGVIAIGTFLLAISAFSSLLCFPLGVLTVIRGIGAILVNPIYQNLRVQLLSVQDKISSLEKSLVALKESKNVPNSDEGVLSTPISSKKIRTKLADLNNLSKSIKERLDLNKTPIWRKLLIGFPLLLLSTICLLWILSSLLLSTVAFCWVYLLSYISGFIFIHNVSSFLWYLTSFVLSSFSSTSATMTTIASNVESRLTPWVITRTIFAQAYFLVHFYFGMQRLFKSRMRSVEFIRNNRPSTKISLERFLRYILLALFTCLNGTMVFCITGLFDDLNHSLYPYLSTPPPVFIAPIYLLMPSPIQQTIQGLSSIVILGFPFLLWIIILYRLLLSLVFLFVSWKALRELYSQISFRIAFLEA